jgi:putative oxidoreductase
VPTAKDTQGNRSATDRDQRPTPASVTGGRGADVENIENSRSEKGALMDIGLLILRVVLGLLIIGHGTQKAFGWFNGLGPAATAELFDKWGFRPGRAMVYVAAATECVGGLLITLGIATPAAAAMLVGTLTVACVPNLANGLWATRGGYEPALLYAAMAATLGFTGGGRYSVDALIGLPEPLWVGPAALTLGLVSTVPALARRHAVLTHEASPAQSLQSAQERT